MNRTRRTLALALLALPALHVAATAADSATAEPPWRGEAVRALVAAIDRNDDAEIGRRVAAWDADPVALAYGALRTRLDAGAGPASALEAARRVARAARSGPTPEQLLALVDAWGAWSESDRSRDAALAKAAESATTMKSRRQRAEAVRVLDDAEAATAAAGDSPAGAYLRALRTGLFDRGGTPASTIDRSYEVALAAARSLPWPDLEAETSSYFSTALRRRGDAKEGGARLDAAIAMGSARLSVRRLALLRAARADAHSAADRFAAAIEDASAAAQAFRDHGDVARAAQATGSLARALRGAGRPEEAAAAGERARADAEASGNARELARSDALLGLLAVDAGRFPSAVRRFEQAVAEAERANESDVLAHALANLAQTEAVIGDVEHASGHYARALELRRQTGDRAGAHAIALRVAGLHERAGRPDLAADAYSALAREAERDGLEAARGEALHRLGGAQLASRRDVEALASLTSAVEILGRAGDGVRRAKAESSLARAELRRGLLKEAHAHAAAALDGQRLEPPFRRADAELTSALVLVAEGDARGALDAIRRSIEPCADVVVELGDAEAEDLARHVRDAVELAARACLSLPAGEAAGAAFPFLETGRALLLSRALVQRDVLLAARLPGGLRAEERAGRDEARRALDALARASAGQGSKSSPEVDAARLALDAAYRRRTALLARIGREAGPAIEVLAPAPVTLAELRASLGEDEAFVAYHAASDDTVEQLAALVVTKGRAALVDLGPSGPIFDRASAWIDVVSAPGSDDAALASSLYDSLVRPLEGALGGAAKWIVSPPGELSLVPFAALRRVDGDSARRVVERAEVSLVPSATVLDRLRRRSAGARGSGAVGVADPTPAEGRSGLPATREEIDAVLGLYPEHQRLVGDDATIEGVRRAIEAPRGRLAAIELATHGVFDESHPRLSGLVLAGGARLFFDDVASWRVDADLVVLSGCETAKGPVRAVEGVLGFARAFFLAGCPRVVASSWRVADAATGALLTSFHEHRTKRGAAPGTALRAAQLERVRAAGPAAHPSAWAAFQLWGLPE